MRMQKLNFRLVYLGISILIFFGSCDKGNLVDNLGDQNNRDIAIANVSGKNATTIASLPVLGGKLVYHKYDCYGCSDTRIYIYNFATNALTWVSQYWNIDFPMNAHFNEDASKIVFMGQPAGSGDWDIYIWTVGSTSAPVNLTAGNGKRDEDPKFSPNGYRIAFKQDNDLKIMETNGTITDVVTSTSSLEEGMPYYSDDATQLIFAQGAGSASDIYKINIDGTGKTAIANASGIQEYYPIVWGPTKYLYSRWYSTTNGHDQVYMGYFSGATPTRLPFNTTTADYSDAFPCGTDHVILSSTKSGGSGGYDLYVANITTGDIYSLNSYNTGINSTLNELGACYK
ncbi:TolB family protein [Pedobacter xixiisoli]|uniref:WD40-like Beta Propeller Repeat n=1 Tax=Pedobacter xixiisoli TaxID=1476464 RepID=A0A285ZVU9_9SPHI|nr:PD40 domain-containing protein [Pedobacter xixiisoli]SOD13768.1 WD40-like Beta Propeller Repeat [Pedobacter xixiisoli]